MTCARCVYSLFYWFSRFEFAPMEARILRTTKVGEAAIPGSIGSFCQDQTFAVADLNGQARSQAVLSPMRDSVRFALSVPR